MNIILCDNYDDASQKAYKLLLEELKRNSSAVLGLPTGSTPLGLYKFMTDGFSEGDFSYEDIVTFNLDEYAGLSRDDPNSYFKFMMDNLFRALDVKIENINIPSGLGELEENCRIYDKKLEEAGGIDIQILGIGRNGHIGFNEPGTPFELTTHIAELSTHTREDNSRFFTSLDEVPTKAVTLGVKSIMNARKIILIAVGNEKADALYNTIHGPVTLDCPSSILQMHPDITLFLDGAAGSRL
ncbi:MAG: glucosamine-6-phosphate deaminase [Spirochaetales bacterium]|nr:glucosamine-6-phosphate deaminase [Spirochaetales bacterium]